MFDTYGVAEVDRIIRSMYTYQVCSSPARISNHRWHPQYSTPGVETESLRRRDSAGIPKARDLINMVFSGDDQAPVRYYPSSMNDFRMHSPFATQYDMDVIHLKIWNP